MFQSLGYTPARELELRTLSNDFGSPLSAARIAAEHRGAYDLITPDSTVVASLSGRLRRQLADREQMPAVGDWVGIASTGRIEGLLSRTSVLVRRAAGSQSEMQLIAANLDWVLIVTSANQDFNPRRIERYVAAILEGGAEPVLVLNKIDLCTDVEDYLSQLDGTCRALPVAPVSALNQQGYHQLLRWAGSGQTVALVGSSGVGKSTLANWLLGSNALNTGDIRQTDDHGKHTTTGRALFPLPGGGALIDTPGMRELGLWLADSQSLGGFDDIEQLIEQCRFSNCQHSEQPGCAIAMSLQEGTLSARRWRNYEKMQKEVAHQQLGHGHSRKQEIRRRGKQLAAQLRHNKRNRWGRDI